MRPVDIERLRAETLGCANRLHLNNAGSALLAQPILDAMTGHLRLEAEIGGYEAADAAQDAISSTYAALPTCWVAGPTRSPFSTTPRQPGTPRSTPSRCARVIAF